jgi:hypothetical protein
MLRARKRQRNGNDFPTMKYSLASAQSQFDRHWPRHNRNSAFADLCFCAKSRSAYQKRDKNRNPAQPVRPSVILAHQRNSQR